MNFYIHPVTPRGILRIDVTVNDLYQELVFDLNNPNEADMVDRLITLFQGAAENLIDAQDEFTFRTDQTELNAVAATLEEKYKRKFFFRKDRKWSVNDHGFGVDNVHTSEEVNLRYGNYGAPTTPTNISQFRWIVDVKNGEFRKNPYFDSLAAYKKICELNKVPYPLQNETSL